MALGPECSPYGTNVFTTSDLVVYKNMFVRFHRCWLLSGAVNSLEADMSSWFPVALEKTGHKSLEYSENHLGTSTQLFWPSPEYGGLTRSIPLMRGSPWKTAFQCLVLASSMLRPATIMITMKTASSTRMQHIATATILNCQGGTVPVRGMAGGATALQFEILIGGNSGRAGRSAGVLETILSAKMSVSGERSRVAERL